MPKAIQIACNNASLFALADDGRIGRMDLVSGSWSNVALPPGVSQRERKVETKVTHRNVPTGYELWRDGETGLWQWKQGETVSEIFPTDEAAVADARHRKMLSTLPTQPTT